MLPAQPLRPRGCPHLLVGGDHDEELSTGRAPAAAAERRGRGHLGGNLVLHVLSASASNLSVHDVARPGIEAPFGGIGWDRIRVAEQAQRRPCALTLQARDQVRPAGLGGQQLAVEAGLRQGLGQQKLGALLVAGRVRGVDPDQLLEQRHRLASDLARVPDWRSRLLAHRPPGYSPRTAPAAGDEASEHERQSQVAEHQPDQATDRRDRERPRQARSVRVRPRRGHTGSGDRECNGCSTPVRRQAKGRAFPRRRRPCRCGCARARWRSSWDRSTCWARGRRFALRWRPGSRTRRSSTGRRAPARRPWRGSSPPPAAGRSRSSRPSTPAAPRSAP